ITGLADIQTDITAKRLELLKETLPHATKFGVLWSTTAPSYRPFLQTAEAAGPKLGVEFISIGVTTAEDFDGALARMGRDGASAVLVHAAALTRVHRAVLAELALKYRLPTMFGNRQSVEAGGLMSYAPAHLHLTPRAAVLLDKILKGGQPSTLPGQQASPDHVVINLKTPRA